MGSIYKRGNIYWIKYSDGGKTFRESSHFKTRGDAKRLLQTREGKVAEGNFAGLGYLKTTFEDIMNLVKVDYQLNGHKSSERLGYSIDHLSKEFKGLKAVGITSEKIRKYITKRQASGAENATINRELSALKRGFSLAQDEKPPLVHDAPKITKLPEHNIRTGYIEHGTYFKLKAALPEYIGPVLVMAYHVGMRKGEILSLPFNYVDTENDVIDLEPGTTKNEELRIIDLSMDPELRAMVLEQLRIRRERYPKCPYLFYHNGKKIRDFRGAWEAALKKCGYRPTFKCKDCHHVVELPDGMDRCELACHHCGGHNLKKWDKVFHDLRRTAVRNMVRAGIPEGVAMRISGHKTRSIFERYNITSEADLRAASEKIAAYHARMQRKLRETEQDDNSPIDGPLSGGPG